MLNKPRYYLTWIKLDQSCFVELNLLVFFMLLSYMWFSRQWKRPSKQLTTLTQSTTSTSLDRTPVLYYRSSRFWLLRWLTHTPATRRIHRLNSSWTNTWCSSSHVEEPTASKFLWIIRLCTTVLHHWPWTCQHQHQKYTYNVSSPSVEYLQLEDEVSWRRSWRWVSSWSWTIIS